MDIKKIFWALLGKSTNILFQAITLWLTVRVLSKYEYGQLATAISISLLLMHFISPGITNLQVKASIENQNNIIQFGKSLFTIPVYGVLVLSFLIGTSFFIYSDYYFCLIIALIFISESIINRTLDLFYSHLQGITKFKEIALWQSIYLLIKLIAVTIVYYIHGNLTTISIAYILSSIICSIFIFIVYELRFKVAEIQFFKKYFFDGIFFALGITAKNAYSNTDKLMLSKMSGFQYSGEFNLAQRIINMAFLPIQAYLSVSYPEFFREGEKKGIQGTVQLLKKIYLLPLMFSLAASSIIFLIAPILPKIFGTEYDNLVLDVRLLSGLPVLQTISYLFADSLTGADFQKERTKIQWLAVGINIALNIILIPIINIEGAIIATLSSEIVMILSYLIFIHKLLK